MAKEKPLDQQLDEVREDDGQIYVDRDKVDFDPGEGLLSGSAFDEKDEDADDSAGTEDAEPAED